MSPITLRASSTHRSSPTGNGDQLASVLPYRCLTRGGIAVIEVADETAAGRIVAADPALGANAGFSYELHPMVNVMVRS